MYCPYVKEIPGSCVSWAASFTASVNRHSSVRARIYRNKNPEWTKKQQQNSREKYNLQNIQCNINADLKYSTLNSALHISAQISHKMYVKSEHR